MNTPYKNLPISEICRRCLRAVHFPEDLLLIAIEGIEHEFFFFYTLLDADFPQLEIHRHQLPMAIQSINSPVTQGENAYYENLEMLGFSDEYASQLITELIEQKHATRN